MENIYKGNTSVFILQHCIHSMCYLPFLCNSCVKIQVRLTWVNDLKWKHPGQTPQTHEVRALISQRLTEIHSFLLHVWPIITPCNEEGHDEPAIPESYYSSNLSSQRSRDRRRAAALRARYHSLNIQVACRYMFVAECNQWGSNNGNMLSRSFILTAFNFNCKQTRLNHELLSRDARNMLTESTY